MMEKQEPDRVHKEHLESPVSFGREICGELPVAEKHEWLVANGIGGFHSIAATMEARNSVAEVLRAWTATAAARKEIRPEWAKGCNA
jgi:hypothetical protein